ncbi:MAG TPA: protein-L-isoaspartate(D-aspartate) O-methyltransferase [Ruminiclostridium sp.]|nr:protein-L-isoaspartate(D-aspartate) O-methyltransferase [Clostridiaceae bacterium]HAA26028.1 protein-L-isoaspartate(D-aspartate) O-methyltransferase [Ruminiclostridium sp.]
MRDKLTEFFYKLNRKDFLDGKYKDYAGLDNPLPIGYGQTISQPSLVLQMTRELELEKTHKVLEIGTGSGYQTAFLAEFSGEVYTVERIAELSNKAKSRIEGLGYKNVHFKIGDGSYGWSEYAPYDRIIVTAAAGRIPDALIDQLKTGGKMILPVGESDLQELVRVIKKDDGRIDKEYLTLVRFVELVGEYGWGGNPR